MMEDEIYVAGPVGFMRSSGAVVEFTSATGAGTFMSGRKTSTATPIKQIQNALKVAPWGEDNRFPQNIVDLMAFCGVGRAALDWKARALYGAGIVPGKIIDIQDNYEVFEPLKRSEYKEVYKFMDNRSLFRFFIEYLQDWVWFRNCFPEVVFTQDCKKVDRLVHQESCDCRFKQMNEQGEIDIVFISKLWGMAQSQFAKFDPEKRVLGVYENPREVTEVDGVYVKQLACIDMYDDVNSARKIAEQEAKKKADQLKSCILPVNYPSPGKTYYQVADWDGARLAGWVEIACKVPSILKQMFKKGMKIQYHIEIPETYFEKKYTAEVWATMKKDKDKAKNARLDLLKEMDTYLTGDKNAYSTFISFFDIDPIKGDEKGRIKITPIEGKYNIDKELLTSSAADLQILGAMGVHPTLFGAGAIGSSQQRTGGSDQREAYLIYNSLLNLERQVAFTPLYFVRDFNGWGDDIVFRVLDTKLTTLDQNKGSTKVLN